VTNLKVKSVHDALSLLYLSSEMNGQPFDDIYEKVVETLYRKATRYLFEGITGVEWDSEIVALKLLEKELKKQHEANQTRNAANKENNSGEAGGDEDGDEDYSAQAQIDVLTTFIVIFAPFRSTSDTSGKKKAHTDAQKIVKYDKTGLAATNRCCKPGFVVFDNLLGIGVALSLIIAFFAKDYGTNPKAGCWAWNNLEFDGFSFTSGKITLLEVKCGQELKKAKIQLDIRTKFIDTVAVLVEYKSDLAISQNASVGGAQG
jgi:hypothetical protein